MSFDDTLHEKVNSLYQDVDLSILPSELQDLMSEKSLSSCLKLYKLSPFLDFYNEYKETLRVITRRDYKVYDCVDILAFMVRNSKLKLERVAELRVALDFYDMQTRLSLYNKALEEKEKFYSTELLWLEEVKSIEVYSRTIPNKLRFIIDKNMEKVVIYLGDVFDKLEHHEKLELVNSSWNQANLDARSIDYSLFLKISHDLIIPKEICRRHPYLMACYGDITEIAKIIVDFSGGEDSTMRQLSKLFSEFSKISESSILIKCQQLARKKI